MSSVKSVALRIEPVRPEPMCEYWTVLILSTSNPNSWSGKTAHLLPRFP